MTGVQTCALPISAASTLDAREDAKRCGAMLHDVVAVNNGYKAIRVDFSDGHFCVGAEDPDYVSFAGEISANLRSLPKAEVAPGMSLAAGVFQARGQNLLGLQVDPPASSQQKWTATALIDPIFLAWAFELNPDGRNIVALMERGQRIVAESRPTPSDTSWLPATETIGLNYSVARAPSRTGATFTYATQPVLEPEFYILSRFDNSTRWMARLRFFVLMLAPLIMLATLYFAYSRAIQSELVRWIHGIRAAMLSRKTGSGAPLAPEDNEMPTELRELSAAFNEMARESAVRERSLKTSLAENEFLLLELNHRVKSSLQIIQSYLSLTRRLEDRKTADQSGVAAMEARVQVLSIAYRKAFSEGRMRDVRIREFAAEIVDNLSRSFCRPGLALELKANIHAALMIDRAIALGLALVESVMAGVDAEDAHVVSVRIGELDDLRAELRVSTDGALAGDKPNARLMAGLALQLDASVESPDPGTIVRWRFQAGPPPVILSSNYEAAI